MYWRQGRGGVVRVGGGLSHSQTALLHHLGGSDSWTKSQANVDCPAWWHGVWSPSDGAGRSWELGARRRDLQAGFSEEKAEERRRSMKLAGGFRQLSWINPDVPY